MFKYVPEEKMAKVLSDIHMAEAALQDVPVKSDRDSVAQIYYQQVMKINDTDPDSFEQQLLDLRKDPKRLKKFYSKVIDQLNATKTK